MEDLHVQNNGIGNTMYTLIQSQLYDDNFN